MKNNLRLDVCKRVDPCSLHKVSIHRTIVAHIFVLVKIFASFRLGHDIGGNSVRVHNFRHESRLQVVLHFLRALTVLLVMLFAHLAQLRDVLVLDALLFLVIVFFFIVILSHDLIVNLFVSLASGLLLVLLDVLLGAALNNWALSFLLGNCSRDIRDGGGHDNFDGQQTVLDHNENEEDCQRRPVLGVYC